MHTGQPLKLTELYAEKSFLGKVAIEKDHKYVGYTSTQSSVETVASKLWAGIVAAELNNFELNLLIEQFEIETTHFNVNNDITDRLSQQKLGKLSSYGFSRKLTRKVQPEPVILWFYFLCNN